MLLSSLSKREKRIAFITAGIIAASALYIFALEPFAKTWVALDEEISAKKIKLQKYTRLISGFAGQNQRYQKYGPSLKEAMSDEQEVALILSDIEAIAAKSGAYLSILKPGPVKDEKRCKRFLIEAELEAQARQLVTFFYQIGNSSRMLKVEGMDISARPEQKDILKARVLISKILFKG